MKYRLALVLLMFTGAPSIAETPSNVRMVTADERRGCEYLGLVTIGSMWAWHSSKGAIKGALRKVEKMGGDSLYLVGQSSDYLSGAAVTGEAYRCATKSQ